MNLDGFACIYIMSELKLKIRMVHKQEGNSMNAIKLRKRIEAVGVNTFKDAALDAYVQGFEAGVDKEKLNGQFAGAKLLRDAFMEGYEKGSAVRTSHPTAEIQIEVGI